MVALGIILIVAGAFVLALGRFAHAHTVGLVVFILGALLILLGVLDVGDGSDAAVLGLPLWRLRDWRYDLDKRCDRLCLWLARKAPGRLRMWTVVDATNTARVMYPEPDGYAGPDGLEYAHIYDGACRQSTPGRRPATLTIHEGH